eukprot:3957310-Amphidinium_carterae.2
MALIKTWINNPQAAQGACVSSRLDVRVCRTGILSRAFFVPSRPLRPRVTSWGGILLSVQHAGAGSTAITLQVLHFHATLYMVTIPAFELQDRPFPLSPHNSSRQ